MATALRANRRWLLLATIGGCVAACALVAWPIGRSASLSAGGMQGFGAVAATRTDERATDPPRVAYIQKPITAEAARVWTALQKPVALQFTHDVPLGDILKYLREATKSPELPNGIQIYADPTGLLEAEITLQSPVTIDLEGVPLTHGLTLLLKQLNLVYSVHDDGLVTLTHDASRSPDARDASIAILEELEMLRHEVSALRTELRAANRGAAN